MQLEPFAYHLAVADRLEQTEPDLWRWFLSEHNASRYLELTNADLQQRTSRLQRRGASEARYALAETAAQRLGVFAPVALYRLTDEMAPCCAFLTFKPDEIAIVFAGGLLERATDEAEALATLGRGVARFHLYGAREGRIHVAEQLLLWLSRQDGCPPEIVETSRRFALLLEAWCDLGGYSASGDRVAAVRACLSSVPGTSAEDANTCLDVADAETGESGSERPHTSSEPLARGVALARAIKSDGSVSTEIAERLVHGPLDLGTLDLLGQDTLRDLTRAIAGRFMSAPGGRTPRVLAHVQDLLGETHGAATDAVTLPAQPLGPSVIDYLAFLLLDLATVEGVRLRDMIAIAAGVADDIGIGVRFRELARQELRGRRGLQVGLARRAA